VLIHYFCIWDGSPTFPLNDLLSHTKLQEIFKFQEPLPQIYRLFIQLQANFVNKTSYLDGRMAMTYTLNSIRTGGRVAEIV